MNREEFCSQVRTRLQSQGEKVLLRIVVSPEFDHPVELTGPAILQRAEELVSSLLPGKERSVVLLLLPHSPELFLLHLGILLKGHVPGILAWPTTRVDPEKYQRNLVHQLSHLPADLLVTLPRLAENLSRSLPYPTTGLTIANQSHYERMFPSGAVAGSLETSEFPEKLAQAASDTLFLQFSGGTTGAQKAIVVSAPMLSEQLTRLGEILGFTGEDGVVSWLPLYHDMGLIACFWLPLWHGAASLHIAASDWVLNPELLFRFIGRHKATFCWLPNFAFSYLSQRRESMREEHRLSSIKGWINCSEPVRHKSVFEFVRTFEGWGVTQESMQASYAMAETVFAITQSTLRCKLPEIPRSVVQSRGRTDHDLAYDLIDDVYVCSGKPIPNTEIKIVASDGATCADLVPGEIYVRSPSLFSGYWGSDGFRTHSLREGWHATGDYGFVSDGELYVIGRFKDIVIVGGNNIFPEDVEAVVNTIPGIYPGRVVAFGIEDKEYETQGLAVVAEMNSDYEEEAALELEGVLRKLILATVGTAPRYVAVTPQRWIVKSTAGKISRRETKEKFIRERLNAPTQESA